MSQKTIYTSIFASAVVGFVVAALTCFVFFFFYKPVQSNGRAEKKEMILLPTSTPFEEIQEAKVNAADVTSVTFETSYKEYYAENSKCHNTYNELYGNDDGIGSSSSPCNAVLTFNRDGSANTSIERWRYDKVTKKRNIVEKSVSTATITDTQFNALVEAIVTNNAFTSWREGTSLYVVNSKVKVTHKNGVKEPMSNIDGKTTDFLAMMNAFKQLESKLDWKKVE